ncbi:MAG: type II secretion system protein [Candidatus Omnitrophica bacterium]|nr:type II secretion system protein [Candidatus Omnitrophota bacterium]
MRRQKGFTLIEILIVVVILAVLASMVLPRFLSQTESAYIAEAQQTLGVLRRAITNQLDLGVTVPAVTGSVTADMKILGLQPITATNFTYACTASGATCTATRVGDATKTINLTIAGAFSCGTGYSLIDASKGCKV